MKHHEKFISALQTLFNSWGGDTPPEAFWAANELLDWYEEEYNVKLNIRFDEEAYYSDQYDNQEQVYAAIRNS